MKRQVVVLSEAYLGLVVGFGLPGVISSQFCNGNCSLNRMLTTIVKTTLKVFLKSHNL